MRSRRQPAHQSSYTGTTRSPRGRFSSPAAKSDYFVSPIPKHGAPVAFQFSIMSLRDRLLALLRDPAYSPGNEFELARRLDLKKRERASLAHEVRLLLKDGHFVRAGNGRIAPRKEGGQPARTVESRKIFVPTRRGPTL